MSEVIVKSLECNVNAVALVWNVFLEFEAPDYSQEGIDEFYKSIHDEKYLQQLCMYGAFMNDELVGVIATRSEGSHIALFFVKGRYHRHGIGKKLFSVAQENCTSEKMTVNSSPFAIPVYEKLGFLKIGEEQTVSGIRFTPMEKLLHSMLFEDIETERLLLKNISYDDREFI